MSALDLAVGAVLTLLVHATVLLGAVWLAERAGALRHPGWAELAWRAALLGALMSTTAHVARSWPAPAPAMAAVVPAPADPIGAARDARPSAPSAASVAPAGSTGKRADALSDTVADSPGAALAATSATSAPARGFVLHGGVAAALVAGWALALLAALGRFAWQVRSVQRLARQAAHRGAPAPATLVAEAGQEAAALGLVAPTLHLLDGVASPMLLPGRRLLLPAWVPALSPAQRRALLAHELAHLQRHDPAWRVLQRLVALPLCVHPLTWHALARLDALAEDACDARAARAAGSGRPLAECLAACLAHAVPRPAPAFAVAMADRPGPVVRRVRNLLENPPMSDRSVPPLLRRTALAVGLALAVLVPGVAVTTIAADAFADDIVQALDLDGGSSFRHRSDDGDSALDVHIRGDVEFNDAENDVVRLGKGARLTVAETRDGVDREVRVFGRDGRIVREYRVDGDVADFATEGRAWLATMLPRVIRESAVDAEGRGKRFLARGGADALLDEIDLIRSDYARGRYLPVLFEHATLDDARFARAIAQTGRIESDFELRRALQAAAGIEAFPPSRMAALLAAAAGLESDFELAELLTSLVGTHGIDAALLPAWRDALARIGSDFEHRRVLDALIERGGDTPGVVLLALQAAEGIGSDFERRQVLDAAAPYLRGDAATRAAWFRTAGGLGSDFETRAALDAALGAGPVDVAFADAVLAIVDGMGSDFERREVLVTLAAKMPDDAALRERYRAAARALGDFERGEAERALDRFASA